MDLEFEIAGMGSAYGVDTMRKTILAGLALVGFVLCSLGEPLPPLLHNSMTTNNPPPLASSSAFGLMSTNMLNQLETVPYNEDGAFAVPMAGWNSWYADGADFGWTNSASNGPFFSVTNFVAYLIVTGLRDAGYNWFIISEGATSPYRDANNNIIWNTNRYPAGMKVVVDYLHNLGFKVGLYLEPTEYLLDSDYTTYNGTYVGAPLEYASIDATNFAAIGFDGFDTDYRGTGLPGDYETHGFEYYARAMRQALSASGRTIAYYSSGLSPQAPWFKSVFTMWDELGYYSQSVAGIYSNTSAPYYITVGDFTPWAEYLRFDLDMQHPGWIGPGHFIFQESMRMANNTSSSGILHDRTVMAFCEMQRSARMMAGIPIPGNYPYQLGDLKNPIYISMCNDPMVQQGRLLTRSNWADVYVQELNDLEVGIRSKGLLLYNRLTNISQNISVYLPGLGFSSNNIAVTDVFNYTNVPIVNGVITMSVPTNNATLLLVQGSAGKSALAPSASLTKPMMGFHPYLAYGFATTSTQYVQMAQTINTNGMTALGNRYVLMTEWMSSARDTNGNMVANPTYFPANYGLAQCIADMHTNPGVKVILAWGFNWTNFDSGTPFIGSGGPLGDNQYLSQDISNALFTYNADVIDLEYSVGNGSFGRNKTMSDYDGIAQSILQGYLGHPFPLVTYNWDTGDFWGPLQNPPVTTIPIYPIVPNGINAFSLNSILPSGATVQQQYWMRLMNDINRAASYLSLDSSGTFLQIYEAPVQWGPGYAIAYAAIASPLFYSLPYDSSTPNYLANENDSDIQKLLYDPLTKPGVLVVSNANYQLWRRDKSDGSKFMALLNPSVSNSVTCGFTSTDAGFDVAQNFNLYDVVYKTNLNGINVYTSTIPAMTNYGFIVSPVPSGFTMTSNSTTFSAASQVGIFPGAIMVQGNVYSNSFAGIVFTNNVLNPGYPTGWLGVRTDIGTLSILSNAAWSVIGSSGSFNYGGNGFYTGSNTFIGPSYFANSVTVSNAQWLTNNLEWIRGSDWTINGGARLTVPNYSSGDNYYFTDGYSLAGGSAGEVDVYVPNWITNVTLIETWSLGSTTTASTWTNTVNAFYSSLGGRIAANSQAQVVTVPIGVWTNFTISINWPNTNTPKYFSISMATATNTANRYLVSPIYAEYLHP